jgi:hypothetical protein
MKGVPGGTKGVYLETRNPDFTPMPAFMRGDGPRLPCSWPSVRHLFNTDLRGHQAVKEVAAAVAVCKSGPCPFLAECRRWAEDNHQRGVWGGTSEHERQGFPRRKRKEYADAT